MNCLTLEQIYLYLERELSLFENKKVEEHVAQCPKCRHALEERGLLLQAAESLPSLEVPPDFGQLVMARLSTKKQSFIGWAVAAAGVLSSLVLAFLIFALASGQNFSQFLVRLNHALWSYIQNASLFFVKFFKLVSLLIKVLHQLGQELLKGFSFLTMLIGWEVQIIIMTIILALLLSLGLRMRRKYLAGE